MREKMKTQKGERLIGNADMALALINLSKVARYARSLTTEPLKGSRAYNGG
jgi:hypothetical protein